MGDIHAPVTVQRDTSEWKCVEDSVPPLPRIACSSNQQSTAEAVARAVLDLADASHAFDRLAVCSPHAATTLLISFREESCALQLEQWSAVPPWPDGHAMRSITVMHDVATDLRLDVSSKRSSGRVAYDAQLRAPRCGHELRAAVSYTADGHYSASWVGDEVEKTDVREGSKLERP
jgi:hypothetical protein